MIADAAYAASKASVLSMVKSFAREFAGRGIRVNALTPGPSDTPMHGLRGAEGADLRRTADGPDGQAGRDGGGDLYLSSPAASFVYGASLNVDGGSMFE
jgi:3-oxoacyl-[acyl-carrier protein] reductase